jgi:hypothetical protein
MKQKRFGWRYVRRPRKVRTLENVAKIDSQSSNLAIYLLNEEDYAALFLVAIL